MFAGHSLGGIESPHRPPLPQAIDDSLMSDEVGRFGEQPETQPSSLIPFVETIKLHKILSKASDRDTGHAESAVTIAIKIQSLLSLDTMINDWRDALPQCLQFELSCEGGTGEIDGIERRQKSGSLLFTPAKKMYLKYGCPKYCGKTEC